MTGGELQVKFTERRSMMWKISKLGGKVWSCIGPGAGRVLRDIRAGRENQLYAGN